jgi:TrmH family RNA methyltransferase
MSVDWLKVTSRENARLKTLRKAMADPASYRKEGWAWLEGEHLLLAGHAKSWVFDGQACEVIGVISERAAQQAHLSRLMQGLAEVLLMPDGLFADISSLETSAKLGVMLRIPQHEGIHAKVPSLILDRVQDAGNVGSILRSCAALGVRQVVALKGTAALWAPKVLRAAMGAHASLHLVELAQVDDLAKLQIPLLCTSSHQGQDVHQALIPQPCAWVMGHEGQGVSADLLAQCHLNVRIPQPGGEESLNVAVAAAICMYEAMRQGLAQQN